MNLGYVTDILNKKNRFVIAELGSNHNGELGLAKLLIESAANSGADAVKLQLFTAEDLVSPSHSAFDQIRSLEVSFDRFIELRAFAKAKNIELFASAFNYAALEFLIDQNVFALKIASSEAVNLQALTKYAKTNIPIFISFGMTEWYEVEMAMSQLMVFGKEDIIPFHCIANYPLKVEDANLQTIRGLASRYGGVIGFSDHTMSLEIGSWAFSMGASIFEKHITLDKRSIGPDHSYALEPNEFKTYITLINQFQSSIGSYSKKYSESEIAGRGRLGTFAKVSLSAGSQLNYDNIEIRGPRLGIPSNMVANFIGAKMKNSVMAGKHISFSDLDI